MLKEVLDGFVDNCNAPLGSESKGWWTTMIVGGIALGLFGPLIIAVGVGCLLGYCTWMFVRMFLPKL